MARIDALATAETASEAVQRGGGVAIAVAIVAAAWRWWSCCVAQLSCAWAFLMVREWKGVKVFAFQIKTDRTCDGGGR